MGQNEYAGKKAHSIIVDDCASTLPPEPGMIDLGHAKQQRMDPPNNSDRFNLDALAMAKAELDELVNIWPARNPDGNPLNTRAEDETTTSTEPQNEENLT